MYPHLPLYDFSTELQVISFKENHLYWILTGVLGFITGFLGLITGFEMLDLSQKGDSLGIYLFIHPFLAICSLILLSLAIYPLIASKVPEHYYYYALIIIPIALTLLLVFGRLFDLNEVVDDFFQVILL